MGYTSGPADPHMVDYAGVLRRRWWVIVVVTIIGTLGAVGYLLVASKVYTATASVEVTATAGTGNEAANSHTTGAVNLDTESQIVQSVSVAQAAAKLMHATDTPGQLIGRVSVTVPPNSQVMTIGCHAHSPGVAATCAQSFAQAYLSYVSSRTTSLVDAQILVLQKQISSLQSKSAKLSAQIAALPSGSSSRAVASQEFTSDNTQLASLNNQIAQLTEQLANPSGGSIISSAVVPTSPSSPRKLIVIPSGLVAGLLIGLIAAFVVDRRAWRIHAPRDIARSNVPVLMNLLPRGFAPELTIAAPRSVAGREFSELAHVLTGSLSAGNHVVVVTGASGGPGTSLVAGNLAAALSRFQPEVTLVCANLDGSAIPDMAGLPSAPGLTDLLAGQAMQANGSVTQRLPVAPGLRVITAGSQPADPRPDAVVRLLVSLRDTVGWVVVEACAVTADPDVYTLAHAADAVVLVADLPQTSSDQVVNAVQHLERVGSPALGVVLVPPLKTPRAPRAPQPVVEGNVRVQSRG
jgi:capsular polysaccharide biosynthesis protein